ncbi:hypothetical protein ACFLZZ_03655 [Nanoarchaeota archaeon]
MKNEMLGDRKRKGLYQKAKQRSAEANKEVELDEERRRLNPEIETPEETPEIHTDYDPTKYVFLEGKKYHTSGEPNVPSKFSYRDTLVSMKRRLEELKWHDAHDLLHKDHEFMLTPRQFVDYLNLLRHGLNGNKEVLDGNKNPLQKDEIKSQLHDLALFTGGEWINAYFSAKGIFLEMECVGVNERDSSKLEAKIKELVDKNTLAHGAQVSLLEDSVSDQGLPIAKKLTPAIYYHAPKMGNAMSVYYVEEGGKTVYNCSATPDVPKFVRGARLYTPKKRSGNDEIFTGIIGQRSDRTTPRK